MLVFLLGHLDSSGFLSSGSSSSSREAANKGGEGGGHVLDGHVDGGAATAVLVSSSVEAGTPTEEMA